MLMNSQGSPDAMEAAASVPKADAAAARRGKEHLYSISGISEILGCSSQPSPQLLDATSSAASCAHAPKLAPTPQLSLRARTAITAAHRVYSTSTSCTHMPDSSVSSSMQS